MSGTTKRASENKRAKQSFTEEATFFHQLEEHMGNLEQEIKYLAGILVLAVAENLVARP